MANEALTAAAVLAAEAGSSFDPLQMLASAGLPGVVILLLITGKLRTESEVKRLEADNERLHGIIATKDELIAALNSSIVDRAIPALTTSTHVLERLSTTRPS